MIEWDSSVAVSAIASILIEEKLGFNTRNARLIAALNFLLFDRKTCWGFEDGMIKHQIYPICKFVV